MTDLFVYGTLMDADVRQRVCGKPLNDLEPASIRGYRCVHVKGQSYPVLRPQTGGLVPGFLLHRLDLACMARLCAYEGGEYQLAESRIVVAFGPTISAQVFLPTASVQDDGRPWRFEEWQKRHKRSFLLTLPRRPE